MAEHNEGHSLAAWTAVGILLLASFLICLAVALKSWPMAVVGIVLAVVGMAAGKILSMAGYGQRKQEASTSTQVR